MFQINSIRHLAEVAKRHKNQTYVFCHALETYVVLSLPSWKYRIGNGGGKKSFMTFLIKYNFLTINKYGQSVSSPTVTEEVEFSCFR